MFLYRARWLVLPIAMALTVTGCATLSVEECRLGNWQAIGFADGAAGYSPERLASHNKACAKAGVMPDWQAWEAGRQQGLKQYCTSANAYQLGTQNRSVNAVCPQAMWASLQRANEQGRQVYQLMAQIEQDKEQLATYRQQYDQLRAGEMLHFTTERDARQYLLSLPSKMRDLSDRIRRNELTLDQIQ